MSARVIRMQRIVDAPPERVYRMWADADTMRQWLCYEVRGSLLPGARSTLVFPRSQVDVDVLEAEPDRRFKFRWLHETEPELATEVTVDIRPKGWGSVVSLSDGSYETDVEANLDEYAQAIELWAAGLTQLRASVDYSVDLRKEQ